MRYSSFNKFPFPYHAFLHLIVFLHGLFFHRLRNVFSFSSLKAVRAKVWQARSESPLFDCKKYVEGMEDLFVKMWDKFSRGEKPDHILNSAPSLKAHA